jgi:hypothetical protein
MKSLFSIPTYVANKLERLQQNYVEDVFKFHLVEWNTVCFPIKNGAWSDKIGHI